jgi:hypothetical protein
MTELSIYAINLSLIIFHNTNLGIIPHFDIFVFVIDRFDITNKKIKSNILLTFY